MGLFSRRPPRASFDPTTRRERITPGNWVAVGIVGLGATVFAEYVVAISSAITKTALVVIDKINGNDPVPQLESSQGRIDLSSLQPDYAVPAERTPIVRPTDVPGLAPEVDRSVSPPPMTL